MRITRHGSEKNKGTFTLVSAEDSKHRKIIFNQRWIQGQKPGPSEITTVIRGAPCPHSESYHDYFISHTLADVVELLVTLAEEGQRKAPNELRKALSSFEAIAAIEKLKLCALGMSSTDTINDAIKTTNQLKSKVAELERENRRLTSIVNEWEEAE